MQIEVHRFLYKMAFVSASYLKTEGGKKDIYMVGMMQSRGQSFCADIRASVRKWVHANDASE